MTAAADTRIFAGSTLKVDDLAASYISTGELISMPMSFGAIKSKINLGTAAETFNKVDLGIPDYGDATFEFFLDMDDNFQKEMVEMYNSTDVASQIREFVLTLPEGTKTECTFEAFVIDCTTIANPFDDYAKTTLTLCIQSRPTWAAPTP